jgi:hypothetical protein
MDQSECFAGLDVFEVILEREPVSVLAIDPTKVKFVSGFLASGSVDKYRMQASCLKAFAVT